MMDDGYLEQFLDADELSNEPLEEVEKEKIPKWVSSENSSLNAYNALLLLNKKKKAYIKKHGLKSQYIIKSNYQIKKSEVARATGKTAQPLFHSTAYSESLLRFFNQLNKQLEEAKEKRILTVKNGLQSRNKEDLVNEHKDLLKNHEETQLQTVDGVYQRLLDNMSLDVKSKLGLI
ncbi:hypothetical protein Ping_0152 [Psychromonas ingrahamii 37]|uniref:Uncharacterized protein n=1 Tax=Psychromonas ingrahamii (strain DSM 17664 / CCUG 51855 / 37) TaxID=357804 RepID=A1SRA5_PSYIN|nr:hypothetical protein [Psychromonas ingrahamii]ABM02020.1 hypothetical protein Ping_0152 [Psychromonas ingrahamii 37]